MRGAIIFGFIAAGLVSGTDADAWEFSPSPICTVTDNGSDTDLKLTYDGALYTLELTHPEGWTNAEIFAIRFAPNGPFIQTTLHQITGSTLSVSDTGFGNVLTGLQNNVIAQALLGETIHEIALDGAFDPVEKLKNCEPGAALS
ncbi:excinuclease ABC subunit B [Planktotalea sp.]|uniref:excinuclease ABC subunit B n=1 Tax=Planktotalea sp. TaxID=2029877 RepID=UPI0035C7B6DC